MIQLGRSGTTASRSRLTDWPNCWPTSKLRRVPCASQMARLRVTSASGFRMPGADTCRRVTASKTPCYGLVTAPKVPPDPLFMRLVTVLRLQRGGTRVRSPKMGSFRSRKTGNSDGRRHHHYRLRRDGQAFEPARKLGKGPSAQSGGRSDPLPPVWTVRPIRVGAFRAGQVAGASP